MARLFLPRSGNGNGPSTRRCAPPIRHACRGRGHGSAKGSTHGHLRAHRHRPRRACSPPRLPTVAGNGIARGAPPATKYRSARASPTCRPFGLPASPRSRRRQFDPSLSRRSRRSARRSAARRTSAMPLAAARGRRCAGDDEHCPTRPSLPALVGGERQGRQAGEPASAARL